MGQLHKQRGSLLQSQLDACQRRLERRNLSHPRIRIDVPHTLRGAFRLAGERREDAASHSAALQNLIVGYHELNVSTIDELTLEPSPLEFMRYVARNRPFVVRGGASNWPATRHWDAQYLRDVMGSSAVKVAITPAGFVCLCGVGVGSEADGLEGMRILLP